MADVAKVLYVVILDYEEQLKKEKESFRYTRPVLQSTLQLMGCKARHAFKVLHLSRFLSLYFLNFRLFVFYCRLIFLHLCHYFVFSHVFHFLRIWILVVEGGSASSLLFLVYEFYLFLLL